MLKLRPHAGAVTPLLALLCVAALAEPAVGTFATFESGQVRPLALSPDGNQLFAVNTPDGQLEIFAVSGAGLTHTASVPVGMEPVAVAARTDTEVWVVNHLSDSVSIVDVGSTPPRVVRTLLVGDEPRDIVFAGDTDVNGNFTRAFITTARRGQNSPIDPKLTEPGFPRALVWVFDAEDLGSSLEGDPDEIVELFGDTPRALAATADGSTVYAAVFHSGNQTASVTEGAVCNGGAGAAPCSGDGIISPGGLPSGDRPGGLPLPNQADSVTGPEVGLVVKYNNAISTWEDELGRNWNNAIRFTLPDYDVFAIDAQAAEPMETASYAHVGTILFNMLVNPSNGKVYVTNTEAKNEVRFEGPGVAAAGVKPPGEPPTVRGHLHEARITVLDGSSVSPRHLNKHIALQSSGYLTAPTEMGVKEKSLATPLDMALASDGTLYVAAFGSSKVGTFNATQLETNSFTPDAATHIEVTGGGPSGLALDEANGRLYVLTRFDNAVKVIDITAMPKVEIAQHPLHNPEPEAVVNGRPVLYDARLTSSNGEASCASCHVFGDLDSLGWDLGDPDGLVMTNPNPGVPGLFGGQPFHPMKGPMTTQTLRGLANHGPMHWRGDRTGGNAMPPGDPLDEALAFKAFIVAFEGLMGRDAPLPQADMDAFTDFILEVVPPPNPVRALTNTLTPAQSAGRNLYLSGPPTDGGRTCNGCHNLDPSQGFFGTAGLSSFEGETQEFKVAHLRNAYQKVGMFGMPDVSFVTLAPPENNFQFDQIRGFGFLHDGSIDTIFHFLRATVFSFPNGDTDRRNLEQFVLAFDTTFAPMVGQQVTLTSTNSAAVSSRITDMITRATTAFPLVGQPGATECDLIVKGTVAGEARGYLMNAAGNFQSDRAGEPLLSDTALRAKATVGQELTYTCVPPGSGQRLGIDRDADGFLDRDELDACSSPQDQISVPGGTAARLVSAKKMLIKNKTPDDESKNKIVVLAKNACISTPPPGSPGDPRCGLSPPGTVKAAIRVSSATSGHSHTTDLPCQNWKLIGSESNPKGYKYKDKELDDGTAKRVVWRNGRLLKAVLKGKGTTALDYDLQVGVSEGLVQVAFATDVDQVCLGCTSAKGKDGSDGKKFLGKSATCPAPLSCP